MTESCKRVNNVPDPLEMARVYTRKLKHYFDATRYEVDKLELPINDDHWPLVKYRELLFIKLKR